MMFANHHRRRVGQSLVETVLGVVVIIPVVLALLDLVTVMYAASLNDIACRNAARAAAAGDPAEADGRARLIINRANAAGFCNQFAHFEIISPVSTSITAQPSLQIDTDTGLKVSPGGMVSGTIGVTTQVEVRPFILSTMCKSKAPFIFRSMQSSPIRYMELAGTVSKKIDANI